MNNQTHNEQVWNKVLNSNEELKYEFSIGNQYIKTYLIIFAFVSLAGLFLAPIVFGIAFLYFKVYLPRANIYGFTNKRILIHRGFFSTSLISIDYSKITDVSVRESFLDKNITKSGQLHINTAGSGAKEVILKNIENPYDIKKKLDELRDNLIK